VGDVRERRPARSGHGDVAELTGPRAGEMTRRRFMGYLIAGPVLIAGVELGLAPTTTKAAGLASTQPVDTVDLSDILTLAATPSFPLLTVQVNPNGTATFALPRAEVGQGLTTAFAMIIADEMGLPLDKVSVVLADANSAFGYNQLTGGSNSVHALYDPVRQAAATARGQLQRTAARRLGGSASDYDVQNGVVSDGNGRAASVASLAKAAAVSRNTRVKAQLRNPASFRLVGTGVPRIDALESITGRKQFAMDLEVPGALPTMICRPPTINGSALSLQNASQIQGMPGVTDVAIIPHTSFVQGGVAVRAQTFGQCIDAIRAMQVTWGPGSMDGKSASDVMKDLQSAELPLAPAPPGNTVEQLFTFNFRPGDPLETNCAVADVRANSAEVWGAMKSPIWAKQQIATFLGMSGDAVQAHVVQGGGSFGRHLFNDAPFEAAACSAKFGKPVKLMWHRTDNFRHGRVHPMAISRVRITYSGGNVLSYDQSHTGVTCDFTQGLGDAITAGVDALPYANFTGFSNGVFYFTASVPYNFGPIAQALAEIYQYNTVNTSSVRNVYSPDLCTSTEVMVDQAANAMGIDPFTFRQQFLRDKRLLAVLNKAAEVGNWGRSMPAGTAQGIAVHKEYKGAAAVLTEIDCTPATVNRKVENGFTGPRVTKVVIAADPGTVINLLGYEAQLMGAAMDGIGQALTYGTHLRNGMYLEGSWDNAYYTRQWNAPPEMQFIVMPSGDPPGGAGEFACGVTMASVACAYARATGTVPTIFPINYSEPLGFTPYPTSPPIPASPTDGLNRAY
jgi:isoquinoline 1-oxidoreductase beta subunit